MNQRGFHHETFLTAETPHTTRHNGERGGRSIRLQLQMNIRILSPEAVNRPLGGGGWGAQLVNCSHSFYSPGFSYVTKEFIPDSFLRFGADTQTKRCT